MALSDTSPFDDTEGGTLDQSRLDFLLERVSDRTLNVIREENEIEAVFHVRKETGATLKEAMAVVRVLGRRLAP